MVRIFMAATSTVMVPSWYRHGTVMVPSWYRHGTVMVPSGGEVGVDMADVVRASVLGLGCSCMGSNPVSGSNENGRWDDPPTPPYRRPTYHTII